jgi:hypothetical protein
MSDSKIVSLVTTETENLHVPTVGETIAEKLADAFTPGYAAEFDPEEAEMAGAFTEDALTEQDAAESSVDLTNQG